MKKMKRLLAALIMSLTAGCTAKKPDGNIMDGDGMMRDFYSYDLEGRWLEIWPMPQEELIFEADQVRFITADGKEIKIAYSISDGSELRDYDHIISLQAEDLPFSELLYQDHDTEAGRKGYLFGIMAITGDEDPYQTVCVFRREDDRTDYTQAGLPHFLGRTEKQPQ